MITSEWRSRAVRGAGVGLELFGGLSDAAVELLDGLLKPQAVRWSWPQIIQCEFVARTQTGDITAVMLSGTGLQQTEQMDD